MSVEYRSFGAFESPGDFRTPPRSTSAGRLRSVSRGRERERTTPGKGIVPASHLPSLLTPTRGAGSGGLSLPRLSDLDSIQRDRCWQMLLEDNEAVFQLDHDGYVIATVHFNADEVCPNYQ